MKPIVSAVAVAAVAVAAVLVIAAMWAWFAPDLCNLEDACTPDAPIDTP